MERKVICDGLRRGELESSDTLLKYYVLKYYIHTFTVGFCETEQFDMT